ncbi:MAG: phytanoyl-CoA dioxygenase family protein [Myxococcota bacterium]
MTDPLPDLSDPFPLPAACVDEYRSRGHTVVRGLASVAEVAAQRPAIEKAVERHRRERRPLGERDTYGRAFVQVPNLWRRAPIVRAFVHARRFARVAAELMGVPGVRLYHDQALFKEAGGGGTPWHQDQYYWPLDTPHTITLWMPLRDVPPEVGSMRFASGSHRLGSLADLPISDASHEVLEAEIRQRGLPVESHGPLRAGDATFHAGWTLHCASANPTPQGRPVMTVIYFADGARVMEPDYPARAFDLRAWLRGCSPGERAAGPLNPLLFGPETSTA